MVFSCCNAWRRAYFQQFDFDASVTIPTDDSEAYAMYPRHHWVHNKLMVAELQGLRAGPFGVSPQSYPIFSKPVYNLSGMSVGARLFRSAEEYESRIRAGTMWCEYLQGDHYSIDCVVEDGAVRWAAFTLGHPLDKGMFDFWEVGVTPPRDVHDHVVGFIEAHLADFTGVVNVETLGGKIIEMHLRVAVQWIDLYGPAFLQALHGLYRDRTWRLDGETGRGFSVVSFAPPKLYPDPPADLWREWNADPSIVYIQLPSYAEDGTFRTLGMPEGGMRLAVVNGTCLDTAMAVRERISRHYGVGRPEPVPVLMEAAS